MNDERKEVHALFSKADAALHAGTITQRERDAFLIDRFGTASEREAIGMLPDAFGLKDEDGGEFSHQAVGLTTGFAVVMITLFSTLFFWSGGITGAVVANLTANGMPAQLAAIPDIVAEGAATIDLSEFFTDPDGDTLAFRSSHHEGNDESVTDGVLTLRGSLGTYLYLAYASDGKGMTSSNPFTVTFTDSAAAPVESLHDRLSALEERHEEVLECLLLLEESTK